MEVDFTEPNNEVWQEEFMESHGAKIQKLATSEKLHIRKAMGPDVVSGWMLRENRKQILVEPVWDVINSSLMERRVPREWRRAKNSVNIYEGGKETEPLKYRLFTN